MKIDFKEKVFQNTLRKNYTLEISEDRREELISELLSFPHCERFCCYLKRTEKEEEEKEAKNKVNNGILHEFFEHYTSQNPEEEKREKEITLSKDKTKRKGKKYTILEEPHNQPLQQQIFSNEEPHEEQTKNQIVVFVIGLWVKKRPIIFEQFCQKLKIPPVQELQNRISNFEKAFSKEKGFRSFFLTFFNLELRKLT